MKKGKIIFITLGCILAIAGLMGLLGAFSVGGCVYFDDSSLASRVVKVQQITPSDTILGFDCVRLGKINDRPITSLTTETKNNFPFGGPTDEGVPDYSKSWDLKAKINGETVEAAGIYQRTLIGLYTENSHWILLVGVILVIAAFFLKKNKPNSVTPPTLKSL